MRQVSNKICIFLLLTMIAWESMPINSGLTINQKYSYSGKAIVDVAVLRQFLGSKQWNSNNFYPYDFIVSLPRQYSGDVQVISALKDFQLRDLSSGIALQTQTYKNNTSTQLYFRVYTGSASKIQQLSIGYLLFVRKEYEKFSIYVCNKNYVGIFRNVTKQSPFTTNFLLCWSFLASIKDGGRMVVFIIGINASSTDNTLSYDIDLSGALIGPGYPTFTLSSTLSTPTYIESIYFSSLFYYPNVINSQGSHYLNLYSGVVLSSNTNTASYSNNRYPLSSINTFVGLTAFSTSNQNNFSFYSSVDQYTITGTSGNILNRLGYSYLILYTSYCSYKSPFYEPVTHQCYSTCPDSSTSDSWSLVCLCLINNIFVDNSNCVQAVSSSPNTIVGASVGGVITIAFLSALIYLLVDRYKKRMIDQQSQNARKQAPIINEIKFGDVKEQSELQVAQQHSFGQSNEKIIYS